MRNTAGVQDIVRNVGGRQNVRSLTHCITRLRFTLLDFSRPFCRCLLPQV
ncbi:MAG TPA: PTS transporter subunit EIIB [Candidatus Scybalocola faecigallinarum]|uniref:PTS transporter subunit EIIB n=1 Tax=Candidatus Scybalocola faecigallinarum TaxID=2840941 RepID=A0A9D1F1V3_9FIRM|nr:PTS transporter subunit EIIB [Candidatus Scybalocola faecigallinarum]